MNRKHLQALAKERIKDATALLGRKRWAAAYYLAGYAVEVGLKACVLKYVGETGAIFSDAKYLKDLGGVWTHDLDKLIALAGLKDELEKATGANPRLKENVITVKDWKETSRYQSADEDKARKLFAAITDNHDGVLQWIRSYW